MVTRRRPTCCNKVDWSFLNIVLKLNGLVVNEGSESTGVSLSVNDSVILNSRLS